MKKIIFAIFVGLILFCGCESMMNTPTKRVEEFLGKYQKQDVDVLNQLDTTITDGVYDFTGTQKDDYKDLMKRQYKDLTYTVKDETIDGDNAVVEVEIEVYDYNKVINDATTYYGSNMDEFKDTTTNQIDDSKFMDYKINKMKESKDRVKYTLNLSLIKQDKKWILNDITEIDRQKIHGLYNS